LTREKAVTQFHKKPNGRKVTREINPLKITNWKHTISITDTRKFDYILKIHLFTYQVVYLLSY